MITCIIIDDNPAVCDTLQLILGEFYSKRITVLAIAESIEVGEAAIIDLRPDIIFLDAHLPNVGGSALISRMYRNHIYKGIETIKIFLYTAKTEVYESIKDSEWRYPVRILNKGIQTIENFGELLEEAQLWIDTERATKTLRIGSEVFYVGDIEYFETDSPSVNVFVNDHAHRAGYPLAHFKKMITDQPTSAMPLPQYFFFATNDYIFNRTSIESYSEDIVTLKNGRQTVLSRIQRPAFETWWRG